MQADGLIYTGYYMSEKNWKAEERRVAELTGGRRTPLSGSNSAITASDVIHPKLYVEVKTRKSSAVITLFKDVEQKARRENKVPLLSIISERKRVWVMRPKDLAKINKYIEEANDGKG